MLLDPTKKTEGTFPIQRLQPEKNEYHSTPMHFPLTRKTARLYFLRTRLRFGSLSRTGNVGSLMEWAFRLRFFLALLLQSRPADGR